MEDRNTDIGNFSGNIFVLLSDKFPYSKRKEIISSIDVQLNCSIMLREVPDTDNLGYFIEYTDDKYLELKDALEIIYQDIPKEDGYPDVYNPNDFGYYPSIHLGEKNLMVWANTIGGIIKKENLETSN